MLVTPSSAGSEAECWRNTHQTSAGAEAERWWSTHQTSAGAEVLRVWGGGGRSAMHVKKLAHQGFRKPGGQSSLKERDPWGAWA